MSATNTIVQYIVVRGDLISSLKWSFGAVIAQACHASSAIMHLFHDDPNVTEYVKDLDRMHKVILKADTEDDLKVLSDSLKLKNIDHKLWIEEPEHIATCLATKPYPKNDIHQFLKHLKLYR